MRDEEWLSRLLKIIWNEHFHDIERKTPIKIIFGKRARNRLGSITYEAKQKVAVIRVTRLFTDEEVPEMIVKATIVHELCHYAHGFHSGLKRQHKHPHAGGVIKAEFEERGLGELYLAQQQWLKTDWPGIVKKHYPDLRFRVRRVPKARFKLLW